MHPRFRVVLTISAIAAVFGLWWFPCIDRIVAEQQPGGDDSVVKVAIPFVAKHCIKCHGGEKPKADFSLSTYTDEKSLIKDRKQWEQVLKMVEGGEMPPQSRPQPTEEEREAFANSLGSLFARLDSAHRDPGRVVMRRLNKAEYANTVRDLLGINFDPTEGFPNDDVSGGFDNNGSVLSLSPLLMERYLDAAETVVQTAFPAEGSWPAPKRLLPNVIQPAPEKGDQRDPRMLRPGKKLFTTVKVDREGEYVFRVLGWHIEGEGGWGIPKIDMEVDEKVAKTFVSTGQGIGLPNFNYCRVQLKAGSHKLAVSWPEAYLAKKLQPTDKAKDQIAKDGAKESKDAGLPKDKKEKDGTSGEKKSEPTPDFEQGYHMRWFEFAGPGTLTAAQKAYFAHNPDLSPTDAAREVLTRFASKAFRRPAQPAEIDRFLKLTQDALQRGEPWEGAVRLAIQAILVSPKFLFRVELDDLPQGKGPQPISDYLLASRLSYFLWSTMPDDQLMDLASKKELHKNLPGQVERMLKDKKAQALSENFAAQWLHLRLLQVVAPDKNVFPDYDEPLRQAMLKETLMFFDSIVREDRSILDLIDGNFTYLNERLAKHYGIIDTKGNRTGQPVTDKGAAIKGSKFVRVQLQGGDRGGILTQASILTVTSNPTRTNIVKRGKWVLEQILNAPPPPPPPAVPELPTDEKAQLTGSLRQRMEKHRADPACANCHSRMDPLGFAFENYDGIGKFRTKDGDFDVDATGVLPSGQTFNGPAELKVILKKQSAKFAKGFAEKMLTYALGRGLEYPDRPAIDKIVRTLGEKEYRFSTLIVELVQSDPFRMRRGKEDD